MDCSISVTERVRAHNTVPTGLVVVSIVAIDGGFDAWGVFTHCSLYLSCVSSKLLYLSRYPCQRFRPFPFHLARLLFPCTGLEWSCGLCSAARLCSSFSYSGTLGVGMAWLWVACVRPSGVWLYEIGGR